MVERHPETTYSAETRRTTGCDDMTNPRLCSTFQNCRTILIKFSVNLNFNDNSKVTAFSPIEFWSEQK